MCIKLTKQFHLICFLSLSTLLLFTLGAEAQSLRRFDSPQQARDALMEAARERDISKLPGLLGPDTVTSILTGDRVAAKATLGNLYKRMQTGVRLIRDGKEIYLWFGEEKMPFAVPIIPFYDKWIFDDTGGKEVIRNRIMKANEMSAIEVCRLIVKAQSQYLSRDRNGDGVREYAQQIISSPGSHNGLYWEDGERSPLTALVGEALREGYIPGRGGNPIYHGYYFRILRSQGPNAPGGSMSYLVGGRMTKGFALLAYPTSWNSSGTRTFVVSADEIIYQKNFWSSTPDMANRINSFDPDPTWQSIGAEE